MTISRSEDCVALHAPGWRIASWPLLSGASLQGTIAEHVKKVETDHIPRKHDKGKRFRTK